MRWVTYRREAGGADRAGLVEGDEVRGLPAGATVIGLLGDDGERMAAAARLATDDPAEVVALSSVTLRAPLQPPVLRDYVGFLGHLRNAMGPGAVMDERFATFPAFYFANAGAVVGPHDDVAVSPGCTMFDYELEVGAVVGRTCSNVPLEEAEACIAGYTIFCDWSARDLQVHEMPMQLGPAKGKDGANTLGPMLVTADELEPHRAGKGFALEMRAYVNDDLVSKGSLADIDWSVADMVAYASRGTTLCAGDVLGSGTVPTGCLFEHFAVGPDAFRGWLQPGDVVTLQVDHLGEVRQRVTAAPPLHPLSTGY